MGLSLYEQEVSIMMNREDSEMSIYVSDPAVMRRLSKLKAYRKTREHRNGGQIVAAEFVADKKLLVLRSKPLKIELSDEEKKRRAETLKRALSNSEAKTPSRARKTTT